MVINWKVRVKNKLFWLALIPALIMLVQAVAKCFGVELELSQVQSNLNDVVQAVFLVLAIFGIVNDPTTAGADDSNQAMSYTEPKNDD